VTTTFLLVRHASCEHMHDLLAGRTTPAALTGAGRAEAARLAAALSGRDISAVWSSPRGRAQQTASVIAAPHGLAAAAHPALDELDYGYWEGRTFVELAADPAWRRWNERRSQAITPGGESFATVRERFFAAVAQWHGTGRQRCCVLVTHAEVIRTAVLTLLGLPADDFGRFEIGPARVTTLVAGPGPHLALAGINERCLQEAVA
jgi:probable phosphoglycerate mutase